MATCPECDKEFDTERGVKVHMGMEHPDQTDEVVHEDLGDRILDAWNNPRSAFLIGIAVGAVMVGSLLLSDAQTFDPAGPSDVGSQVVHHYQSIGPPGVSYTLVDTEQTRYGMHKVTIRVTRGSLTSEETVYVTGNGQYIFATTPEKLRADLSALAD